LGDRIGPHVKFYTRYTPDNQDDSQAPTSAQFSRGTETRAETDPRYRVSAIVREKLTSYDQTTAVYDISAHTVYLPDGKRLEAHSGLGDRIDDPVSWISAITARRPRASSTHAPRIALSWGSGVASDAGRRRVHLQSRWAARASLHAGSERRFQRLRVFQELRRLPARLVKRLAVVSQWAGRPRQFGALASLSQTPYQ
jgi:hypothetical protein